MAIFDEKIEIRERCKGVHCVDLGESFPTRIYLQKSASIQPRTSPSKFGGKIQFNIHFTPYQRRAGGPAAEAPHGCSSPCRETRAGGARLLLHAGINERARLGCCFDSLYVCLASGIWHLASDMIYNLISKKFWPAGGGLFGK